MLTSCVGTSQQTQSEEKEKVFPVTKTDAEWKEELTHEEYTVMRLAGTEYAFSSELLYNKEKGTYVCAATGNPLFRSETKFESGTGWPSFYDYIEGGLGFSTDYKIGYARTELHCSQCGGHLGHVFNDGPEPTGKRYCINGVALDFVADE